MLVLVAVCYECWFFLFVVIQVRMNILDVFIEKVKGTLSPVFLYGGTSSSRKELAKAVHDSLEYRGSEFISIDLAVIPDSLMDSVLFGKSHQKCPVLGVLEGASSATLFLDGVEKLTSNLQIKLMQVLNTQNNILSGGKGDSFRFRIIFGSAYSPKKLYTGVELGRYFLYEICELKFCLDFAELLP